MTRNQRRNVDCCALIPSPQRGNHFSIVPPDASEGGGGGGGGGGGVNDIHQFSINPTCILNLQQLY